jgi:hypothetical protein
MLHLGLFRAAGHANRTRDDVRPKGGETVQCYSGCCIAARFAGTAAAWAGTPNAPAETPAALAPQCAQLWRSNTDSQRIPARPRDGFWRRARFDTKHHDFSAFAEAPLPARARCNKSAEGAVFPPEMLAS